MRRAGFGGHANSMENWTRGSAEGQALGAEQESSRTQGQAGVDSHRLSIRASVLLLFMRLCCTGAGRGVPPAAELLLISAQVGFGCRRFRCRGLAAGPGCRGWDARSGCKGSGCNSGCRAWVQGVGCRGLTAGVRLQGPGSGKHAAMFGLACNPLEQYCLAGRASGRRAVQVCAAQPVRGVTPSLPAHHFPLRSSPTPLICACAVSSGGCGCCNWAQPIKPVTLCHSPPLPSLSQTSPSHTSTPAHVQHSVACAAGAAGAARQGGGSTPGGGEAGGKVVVIRLQ